MRIKNITKILMTSSLLTLSLGSFSYDVFASDVLQEEEKESGGSPVSNVTSVSSPQQQSSFLWRYTFGLFLDSSPSNSTQPSSQAVEKPVVDEKDSSPLPSTSDSSTGGSHGLETIDPTMLEAWAKKKGYTDTNALLQSVMMSGGSDALEEDDGTKELADAMHALKMEGQEEKSEKSNAFYLEGTEALGSIKIGGDSDLNVYPGLTYIVSKKNGKSEKKIAAENLQIHPGFTYNVIRVETTDGTILWTKQ